MHFSFQFLRNIGWLRNRGSWSGLALAQKLLMFSGLPKMDWNIKGCIQCEGSLTGTWPMSSALLFGSKRGMVTAVLLGTKPVDEVSLHILACSAPSTESSKLLRRFVLQA